MVRKLGLVATVAMTLMAACMAGSASATGSPSVRISLSAQKAFFYKGGKLAGVSATDPRMLRARQAAYRECDWRAHLDTGGARCAGLELLHVHAQFRRAKNFNYFL